MAEAALHDGRGTRTAGEVLESARGAVVLVHGRGADAESILSLAAALHRPGIAWIAPQARGGTWYPRSFLAPLEENQPWLDSALALLGATVARVEEAGVPRERTVLAGFSQGACLALEFAARNARRWGGILGLSGGLIGPPGTPRDYAGSFDGTPAFLGCSDRDPHVPRSRVDETARVLAEMRAEVTERIYPGLGHTVNEDELARFRAVLDGLYRE